MANERRGDRRQDRREFRPTLDGAPLEDRKLLAHAASVHIQTAAGGQAVVVTTPDSSRYYVSIFGSGTIKATAASNGRVNLIANGTTVDSLLEINEITSAHSLKAGAHTYDPNNGTPFSDLNVASIKVTSGTIGDIEGYRDAKLSGPITASSTNRVDRIAFAQVLPGASINVGGDLNTLDILNDADFSGSSGLTVGRDLNWFEVGGNLTFENRANMLVGRDLGLVAQAAKGSGNEGQGLFVTGNLTIAAPSTVTIVRNNAFGFVIDGNFSGVSRLSLGQNTGTDNIVLGTQSP